MNALAAVHATPGLAAYMAEVEARPRAGGRPRATGFAGEVADEALAAGGKRLRPLLCFLAAPAEPSRRSRPASRSSSCTWRRSSTTTSSTARGCAAACPPRGRSSAPDAALAAGDYLFACAFAELAATGDSDAVVDARRRAASRSRAARRCSGCRPHDPETTIDAYLERCALKTGKLFEAACLLGSGGEPELGAYGLALGIAFQIADDILDCAGQTQETGKIPGTDLREGTPTMPLLLAAQQDDVVRAALAGGPLDGALVRVAATDALARSREAALDYAAEGAIVPRTPNPTARSSKP